jgi:hypothetical protein
MTNQTRRAFLRSAPIAAVSIGIAEPAAAMVAERSAARTIQDRLTDLKAALEQETGMVWAEIYDLERAGIATLINTGREITVKEFSRHLVDTMVSLPRREAVPKDVANRAVVNHTVTLWNTHPAMKG